MGNKLLKSDENFEGMPTWMATMRKAVLDIVTEDDVKEIVKNQIARAKAGDQNAIKFVFGQVLGGDAMKGATFVQNNNYGDNAAKPTKARPGTDDKIEVMRKRREAGLPLTHDGDGTEAE